jgi:hypothetical protein
MPDVFVVKIPLIVATPPTNVHTFPLLSVIWVADEVIDPITVLLGEDVLTEVSVKAFVRVTVP